MAESPIEVEFAHTGVGRHLGFDELRRKGRLLSKAGEWALSVGEVPEAVHLLALSLTMHGRRPDRDHVAQLSALSYLGEIFDHFGDRKGRRWARKLNQVMELDRQRTVEVCGVLERPITTIDRAQLRQIRKTLTARIGT